MTSGGLLSYTIGIHYLMISDSIWIIQNYSVTIWPSGFHTVGFLNETSLFCEFLKR